jgi:very-short-patch-repair endonuclease
MRIKYDINKIKEILSLYSNTELLSTTYKNNRTPLKFKCGKCGRIFYKRWDNMLTRKKFYCQSCCRSDGSVIKKDKDDCISTIHKYGFKLLSTYKNTKDKLLVEDNMGYRGYISYENISYNKHFSIFSSVFNLNNLIYNLNIFAKNNNIDSVPIKFIKRDKNRSDWVEIRCSCGNHYITNVWNFIRDNVTKCPVCSKRMSKYELEIKKILEHNNVDYISQHTFNDCRNDKTNYILKFDFYLPHLNYIIECDGIQHYKPIDFGGNGEEISKEMFRDIKYRDNIKNKYCKEHNINLLRISYKEFEKNNIKSLIQPILK